MTSFTGSFFDNEVEDNDLWDSDLELLFVDDLSNDDLDDDDDDDEDEDGGLVLTALEASELSISTALSNDSEDTSAEVVVGDETEDGEGGGEGEDMGGGEGDVGWGTNSLGSCLALASLELVLTTSASSLSSESLPKMSWSFEVFLVMALLEVGTFWGVEVRDVTLARVGVVVSDEERSRKSEKRPEPFEDTEDFELFSALCDEFKIDLEDELWWWWLLERLGSVSRLLEWLLLSRWCPEDTFLESDFPAEEEEEWDLWPLWWCLLDNLVSVSESEPLSEMACVVCLATLDAISMDVSFSSSEGSEKRSWEQSKSSGLGSIVVSDSSSASEPGSTVASESELDTAWQLAFLDDWQVLSDWK